MWVEMATRLVEEYVTDYPLRHHMWRVHSDSPRERSVALENSFLNNNMLLAQSYPNLRATHPNCDILSPSTIDCYIAVPWNNPRVKCYLETQQLRNEWIL